MVIASQIIAWSREVCSRPVVGRFWHVGVFVTVTVPCLNADYTYLTRSYQHEHIITNSYCLCDYILLWSFKPQMVSQRWGCPSRELTKLKLRLKKGQFLLWPICKLIAETYSFWASITHGQDTLIPGTPFEAHSFMVGRYLTIVP